MRVRWVRAAPRLRGPGAAARLRPAAWGSGCGRARGGGAERGGRPPLLPPQPRGEEAGRRRRRRQPVPAGGRGS